MDKLIDFYLLNEEIKLSDSLKIDFRNNIYVVTEQKIYVYNLKQKSLNKNWLKYCINIPEILKNHDNKSVFIDEFTYHYNNKEKDIVFLKYIENNGFDSNILRKRILYLNNFNEKSLKITSLKLNDRFPHPLLLVSLNNGESYLIEYKNKSAQYQILTNITKILEKNGKNQQFEEIGPIDFFGKDRLIVNIGLYWYLFINKDNEYILEQEFNIGKIDKFFTTLCNNNNGHIIGVAKGKIIQFDLITNQIKEFLFDFDNIDFGYFQYKGNNDCKCNILMINSNILYEFNLKNSLFKRLNQEESGFPITGISISEESLVLTSNSGCFYNENREYQINNIDFIKSICLSYNNLLNIIIGKSNNNYKILIFRSLNDPLDPISIFYRLFISVRNNIIRENEPYFLKNCIDFSDLRLIFARNFDHFKEVMTLSMTLFDEKTFIGKFKGKKQNLSTDKLILLKENLSKIEPDNKIKEIIIEKVFLNILLIKRKEFLEIIMNLENKIKTRYYKKIIDNPFFNKYINENPFYKTILINLSKYLGLIKVEENNNILTCVICNDNMINNNLCINNHKLLICLFTQELIYKQKLLNCCLCGSFMIDFEKETNLKLYYVQREICPICWNNLKEY